MEQGLKDLNIPVSIIRGAYYMSNWDTELENARKSGMVRSLYPVGFKIPMAAPHDIGEFAAKLMMEPASTIGLHFVEGPEPYSSAEVAEAFSECCKRGRGGGKRPDRNGFQLWRKWVFSRKAAEYMAKRLVSLLNRILDG